MMGVFILSILKRSFCCVVAVNSDLDHLEGGRRWSRESLRDIRSERL